MKGEEQSGLQEGTGEGPVPFFAVQMWVSATEPARGTERSDPVKLLIRQGRLVDPVGGIGGVMDILMEDGKVTVIGSNINEPGAQIIDAAGLTVCAGLVDMHVHLR